MKLARLIAKDPKLARDMYADNNKIEEILFISYTLKILKLVWSSSFAISVICLPFSG